MRTRNPNYGRAIDTVLGRVGTRKAGSSGIRIIDANGTEIIQAQTLRVPWVVDLSEYEAQIGSDTGSQYTNATGSPLTTGDVVIVDGTTVVTTTTAQDTRPVGVIVAGGDNGAIVAVQTAGYCSLVNVTASVTAGNYLETSTTARQATENATRRTGSFGVILTGGTTPSALLFGAPDSTGTGLDLAISHGAMGATETFDVSAGSYHYGTLDANCTFTFTGAVAGEVAFLTLELTEDGTGGWTPTFPVSVVWVNGVAPTHDTTPGSTTIYDFASRDGGTTWFGASGGSSLMVEDEGTPLATAATSLDFVGAGVVASGTGAAKTITISGAPSGSAGGDLSGTYPNPSVVDDSHNHTATTLPSALGTDHVHVAYETHTSDGSTTTFTLDQFYEPGSVMAWNRTTGHVLGITEVLPDQATVSAAGTAADLLDFHYAASVI